MTEEKPPPGTAEMTEDGTIEYHLEDHERLSDVVIRAVATINDTAILELKPLYHIIDPERLNGLFQGRRTPGPWETTIAFDYVGCRVEVAGRFVRVRSH